MDSSVVTPTIDFSKVEAINQKRTLAFINHWVLHTVAFLNQFSTMCEERLIELERKLRCAEFALVLLESKLNSVPDLEDLAATRNQGKKTYSNPAADSGAAGGPKENEAIPPVASTSEEPEGQDVVDAETAAAAAQPVTKPISQDPRYAQYFRMLRMGVPEPAIRMKMSHEGLDPSLLDNPDAPAPSEETPLYSDEDPSSDSDSSWSD